MLPSGGFVATLTTWFSGIAVVVGETSGAVIEPDQERLLVPGQLWRAEYMLSYEPVTTKQNVHILVRYMTPCYRLGCFRISIW